VAGVGGITLFLDFPMVMSYVGSCRLSTKGSYVELLLGVFLAVFEKVTLSDTIQSIIR
jgi:hypothetical protein